MSNVVTNGFKKTVSTAKKIGGAVSTLALSMAVSQQVYAGGLPTVAIPNGDGGNDYVKTTKNIVFGIMGLFIAVVVLVMFVLSAKNTMSVYNEWRQGKATFFDLGTTLAVTIGLIMAVVWLMNTASTQFGLTF
ncbi:TIGR03745 family integrating conjugative element membrane protein [Photobacterium leiognathi]|uniref:TIGR03745 family integrating conjugative element membrane protein n=1 Tax=Photobacterium leiognathi TaxID=553611 RepID=UPI002738479E|nr:TIGR03745 family integrating conjugative element membrane protein [Photobacterium leiognathi]